MRWSEWKAQNSKKQEFEGFADIVEQLSKIDLPKLDKATKARIAVDIGFKNHPHHRAFTYGWSATAAIFLVTILVFAQTAQPGSALYSVRKSSQKVRMIIHETLPFIPDEKTNQIDDSHRNESEGSKSNSGGDSSGSSNSGSDSGSSDGGGSASGGSGSDSSGLSDSSGSGRELTRPND